MTKAAWDDFSHKVQLVARAAELDGRLADLQERYAKDAQPRVTREPRVYDTHSPNSYFMDRMLTTPGR